MKFKTFHGKTVELTVTELTIINFIETALDVEYRGYMTPCEFIDSLYARAKMQSYKNDINK